MPRTLPTEIGVSESPSGVRYELPLRPVPEGIRANLWRAWLGLPVAALGLVPIFLAIMLANGFLFGVGVMLLVVGWLVFASGLAARATRSSVELTAEELTAEEVEQLPAEARRLLGV